MVKTDAERQKDYKERQEGKGLVQVKVAIPVRYHPFVKEVARLLRNNPDLTFDEALVKAGAGVKVLED